MNQEQNVKVAEYWGEEHKSLAKSFYGFPAITDYLYTCISGKVARTERDWCERWVVETYLADKKPVAECLSLCCGFGEVERILSKLGAFKHCTAIDLSPNAIQIATRLAQEQSINNIDFRVDDLNTLELGSEQYDLIYANGALHHLAALERVAAHIHRALKPGGLFVCNEYVGPNYQQLSLRQQEIINSVIHLLPARLRRQTDESYIPLAFQRSRWHRGIYRLYRAISHAAQRLITPAGKAVFHYGKLYEEHSDLIRRRDPSEGVRSHEIIPVLRKVFSDLNVENYNGSVLSYALDTHFYNAFDEHRLEDRAVLDMLFHIEKTMIETGELASDHALIIATKPLALTGL